MRTVELFRLPLFEVHEEGKSTYKDKISFQVNLPISFIIKNFILIPEPKNSKNNLALYLVLEVSGTSDMFLPVVFHAIINGSEIIPNTEYVGTFDTLHTHENQYVVDPPVRYHLYRQKIKKSRKTKNKI